MTTSSTVFNEFKFSILMSVYIKETYDNFTACYKSIIDNSLLPDQIVIVLDGPVNREIFGFIECEINKGIPITLVKSDHNLGLGSALNLGLEFCRNEWVFRMDTDDICINDRFEKQVMFIRNNKDVVLVGGHIAEFDENMEVMTGIKSVPLTYDDIIGFIKYRSPFNHMSVAFRKSAVISVGGYQHHHFMEDYNLWLRIVAGNFKVANVNEILVNVRGGSEMIKRRKGVAYIKSEWLLMKMKYSLKISTCFESLYIFMMRSIPRLLPTSLLNVIYSFLRK
ncbi:glycosyltransferase [Enterobacter hormaechei]